MALKRSAKQARNGLSAQRLRAHLKRHLAEPLAEILLPLLRWRINNRGVTVVLPNHAWEDVFREHALEPTKALLADQQLPLRIVRVDEAIDATHSRQPRFANFIIDPGNQFALSACRRIIEAPGIEHNPFYLHGPTGCGKTHLVQAVVAEYGELLGGDQAFNCTAAEWATKYAPTLSETGASSIRDKLEQCAVICIDDIEGLSNRALAQEQLFHLINNAMERGQQLVVTGTTPPRSLLGMEERLVTRLGWGLSVAIDMPLMETRLALLLELAGDAAADIDRNELARLVETVVPDMHQVVRMADRLVRGEQITPKDEKASFDLVLEHVARHFQVRPGDIAGKRRLRTIAQARQTALMLGRRLTGHSLEALGGMVGGRDHSTVLYSIRQAEERQKQDKEFARQVGTLTREILEAGKGKR